jgi:hypothetical protein
LIPRHAGRSDGDARRVRRRRAASVLPSRLIPRSYSLTTIKTLFGEASTCAHPECDEPLIFTERGRNTAVAEIAHIRSETPGGPRHDSGYAGEVNGSDNLLLLCGKHHRAVDRHESLYSVAELQG